MFHVPDEKLEVSKKILANFMTKMFLFFMLTKRLDEKEKNFMLKEAQSEGIKFIFKFLIMKKIVEPKHYKEGFEFHKEEDRGSKV